ncbi:uncharacterized protein VTP21DRAFT_3427 [Calcarisporiella thermophila]|uniref:uncharacterized protein n=1 Tax=Calcarisporiella thermophila TaxID=911321 RepID=UPI0037429C1A
MSGGELSLHGLAGPSLVASQYSDGSPDISCVTSTLDAATGGSGEDTDPYNVPFTPNAIRFQLRLNSLTDLLRLFSAQFVLEGKPLSNFPFHFQIPDNVCNSRPIQHCSYFRVHHIPKPIENKEISRIKKSLIVKRKLRDYLFHIYVKGCSNGDLHMHPNHASFLESYYNNELEPILVHTAVARTAIHLLLAHPQTPIRDQLHSVVGSLLAQAMKSSEDAFDTPSPQIVAGFLNMNLCMTWLLRFETAYRFHSQAALVAVALQMDREDPNVVDPIEIEFRRRIWAAICYNELDYRFGYGKPELISLDTIIRSPKPTVALDDTGFYKISQSNFKILELRDIDWSLPDNPIIQQLISIAAFLQSGHDETLQYCLEIVSRKCFLSEFRCNFWSDWCSLWRQFIKSDAPPPG